MDDFSFKKIEPTVLYIDQGIGGGKETIGTDCARVEGQMRGD